MNVKGTKKKNQVVKANIMEQQEILGNCSVPSQLRVKMHSKSPSVMAF